MNKEKETAEEKKTAEQPEATPEAAAPAAEAQPQTEPETEKSETEQLKAQLEQLKKELSEEKNLGLRVRAEYDNYRKRTAREMGEISASVRSETIADILPIADNIERALACAEGNGADLRKGVSMVDTQIKNVLTKLNIEIIGAENVPFDPQVHNAVMHIEDDAYGENTVVQVLQKGYKLGSKVLRYAMVKVAN